MGKFSRFLVFWIFTVQNPYNQNSADLYWILLNFIKFYKIRRDFFVLVEFSNSGLNWDIRSCLHFRFFPSVQLPLFGTSKHVYILKCIISFILTDFYFHLIWYENFGLNLSIPVCFTFSPWWRADARWWQLRERAWCRWMSVAQESDCSEQRVHRAGETWKVEAPATATSWAGVGEEGYIGQQKKWKPKVIPFKEVIVF
jgi:hypothetical protein